MSTRQILEDYFDRLWPICRSITGNGLRESLGIIQELIPLNLYETPTGAQAFDWTIPKEWNIRDAFIRTPDGRKVADFKVNNLHVVNYSTPIHQTMEWEELHPHLHTLPAQPDAIPYITSYYNDAWGFCLSQDTYNALPREGRYEVYVDSTLQPGSLTHGDLILKGKTDKEVVFSTYLCHPSMANNELSGPLVTALLYQKIAEIPQRKYTYRFVFAPETIGIINYLSMHGSCMKECTVAGYVVTCVGDDGTFTYKRSKRKTSLADRAAEHVLFHQDEPYRIIDFAVGGSDERQYCSPGFNLPIGSLTRSMYHEYDFYHSSLDNKDFISFEAMERTIDTYFKIVETIEINDLYINRNPFCEPKLGKRNLYYEFGGNPQRNDVIPRILHLLSFSDGETDLIEIASIRNEFVQDYRTPIDLLTEANLLTTDKNESHDG